MESEHQPGVSILIPAYQSHRWLEALIANLKNQTYNNCECLFYDDGSTDGTSEFLNRASAEDASIRVISAERNRGRGFARNRLLGEARFELVAWQDVDDLWVDDKLHKQVDYYVNELAQDATLRDRLIVNSSFYRIDLPGMKSEAIVVPDAYELRDLVFQARNRLPPIQLQTCFGSKRAFLRGGGFSEELNWSEDFEFFLRFFRSGGVVRRVPQPSPLVLYFFSLRGRSAREIEDAHRQIIEQHGAIWTECGLVPEIEFVMRQLRYSFFAYLVNDDSEGAMAYLVRVLPLLAQDDELPQAFSLAFVSWMNRFYAPCKREGRGESAFADGENLSKVLSESNKGKRLAVEFAAPDVVAVRIAIDMPMDTVEVIFCEVSGERLWRDNVALGDGRGSLRVEQRQILQTLSKGIVELEILVKGKGISFKRQFHVVRLQNGIFALAPHI